MNYVLLLAAADATQKIQTWLKVILVIFLVFVLAFALLGLLGVLIEKVMIRQGMKIDSLMSNLVFSKVCDNPKKFKKLANEKNRRYFFKTSFIPLLLMGLGVALYFIYHAAFHIEGYQSIFNTETGVASLLYLFKFEALQSGEGFLSLGFKIVTTNYPHFVEFPATFNYFIFLFFFSGFIWYLVNIQAYVSRKYRIHYLANKMFTKDLSTIDLSHFYDVERINPYGLMKEKVDGNKSTNDSNNNDKQTTN